MQWIVIDANYHRWDDGEASFKNLNDSICVNLMSYNYILGCVDSDEFIFRKLLDRNRNGGDSFLFVFVIVVGLEQVSEYTHDELHRKMNHSFEQRQREN